MLKVLFQSIPSILFEPIAVGAVLGLVTAAVLLWRKKTAWYWSVTFALLFMISWRVAIQIVSSRYASILVFPATIATAYFAFKMDWLAGFIPRLPKWFCRSLPYLAIGGIAIGGFAQLLHYNPYANRIIQVAELIREDAKQYKSCHILATDVRRMQYYTGLPTTAIAGADVSSAEYPKQIALTLKKGSDRPAEMCYVVLPMSAKLPEEHYLQQVSEHIRKELVLLGEFYHNRKKRRLTRVYRYDIQKAYNVAIVPAGTVQIPGRRIRTCTFEKTYPVGSWFHIREDRYFKNPQWNLQSPLLTDFPTEWQPSGTGGYFPGSNGELGVRTFPDGQKVLRLKSDALIALFRIPKMQAEKYRVKLTVSGRPGSVFAFGAHYYGKKHVGFEVLPKVQIPDTGVWDFMLSQKYVLPGAKVMRIALQLFHGEIFVHSIELYEVDDKK
ncbi:MAG: hypothetical protein IJV89_04760 [Lentisphaeria bacterium]|nr:hypothetical protein [Lentisphaeria bacterium]